MKVCISIGTRPEIIKMSSTIRYLEQNGIDYFVVHSGQHYSYSMDKVFFEELELPMCRYNLEVGSGSHATMTARILERIEPILVKERPQWILVQGDTNTVLASALAAAKLGIKIGHVEAGLRSYDRSMPEELNRIMCDHISHALFTPTTQSQDILAREGIPSKIIHTVGNTIVDAVYANIQIARKRGDALSKHGLRKDGYILATAHRQENVDDPIRFQNILSALGETGRKHGLEAFYPIHPRARKMIEAHSLSVPSNVRLAEPCSFFDFLQLEEGARLVMTDSGGVQEETCILGVPCVTLRDNTERPETVECGANILAGTEPDKIMECAEKMLSKKRDWKNPFGDGNTAQKIVQILHSYPI